MDHVLLLEASGIQTGNWLTMVCRYTYASISDFEPRLWPYRYAAEALWSSLPTTDTLLQFIAEDECRVPKTDIFLQSIAEMDAECRPKTIRYELYRYDIWYDDDATQPNDRKSMHCIAEMQHG
jgi:hypothetical protein